MTGWNWTVFCGSAAFTPWRENDFSHCFEQMAFTSTTHLILCIVSIVYAIKFHQLKSLLIGVAPTIPILYFRLVISGLLSLIPLIKCLLLYLWLHSDVYIVDIVTAVTTSLCWLAHLTYLWQFASMAAFQCPLQGPFCLVVSYLLVLAAIFIRLQTIIRLQIEGMTNSVNEYVIYIESFLHLLFVGSLLPCSGALTRDVEGRLLGLENENLLSSTGAWIDYGSFERATERHIGVAYDKNNFFSRLFFCYVKPLLKKGAARNLESCDDTFFMPRLLRTKYVRERFMWFLIGARNCANTDATSTDENEDITAAPVNSLNTDPYDILVNDTDRRRKTKRGTSPDSKRPTILHALHKAFGWEYYVIGLLKLMADIAGFAGPLLLNLLVSYIENRNEPVIHGYYYAGAMFASTLVTALCGSHFNYYVNVVGLKIRAALISAVYHKTLSVNSVTLGEFNSGEVVNFMSTDTDRVVNFCPSFHQFWSLPFQLAVSLYLLYKQVGLAFLAGLGVAVLLIPINKVIAVKIAKLSKEMMGQKDSRVQLMNEILSGIRVVKYYTMEDYFMKKIGRIRSAELSSLKGRKYLDALCVYFWAATPVLISILTFTTYALMGNQLTAAKVFTSLALFNMLMMPLNAFPWVINGLMESWVSLKRLEQFMMLEENDWKQYYNTAHNLQLSKMVNIRNAVFTWNRQRDNAEISQKLSNINLNIHRGELIGIIGKVGSGKSSLLSAILSEMRRVDGSITVANLNNGFGFVGQESWIQHATIRDNILFGRDFNRKRYENVIQACALIDDLKIFPAGDKTEVGENGVTLSGGQKARISLARAVYQDKDIYLLDDPFAAVDAHVAQHIYEFCIMGLLRDKTRILCTHHTYLLHQADMIVIMNNGTIVQTGSPSQVFGSTVIKELKLLEEEDVYSHDEENLVKPSEAPSLMQEEERESGVVQLHVYRAYWKAVGKCLSPLVLLSLLLMQGSRNINDWWLSYWISHSHHSHDNSTYSYSLLNSLPWTNITEANDNVAFYLTVYGILAGSNTVFTFIRAFLFAYGGIVAAKIIHSKLLMSILKAPMKFFDTTPLGRIINRFSTDVYGIDDSLPFMLNILLAQTYGLLGTVVITCYGLPWFLILLVPLGALYYIIQRYYRHTSREMKRLTSVSLSPVYAHFSETVNGLSTIRAFRQNKRFQVKNLLNLDRNQRARYSGLLADQWFGMCLQLIGVAMVTGVAVIAMLEHHFHSVDPGLVGLAISYALTITGLLSGVVTFFSETEKQMVSMERAKQYTDNVPVEKQDGILNAPPFWPLQGGVSFEHVYLKYRPELTDALIDVTFETKPAEKVGIIGRTGSGKSSLFLTLYRMIDVRSGWVTIDGLNVSHLGLKDLRSRLAIIPQDPFLFCGSVRENLDPTDEYSDNEILDVLDKCHMLDAVRHLGGLMADVEEHGRNFSVGQRQLLCLARALLRQAKILCMDEATASVDNETDSWIQQTIRTAFSDKTVLTIAHRIQTIMDYDRVIVMDKGRVVEFAPPSVLLQRTSSVFNSLVRETGEHD
ncbi:ATP-binding cassette sub-family C member 10-like [Tubulanus polymorphus]|uniref:ATP-binding cassette sub-family C member 10-like n=1 Tax=Tubulanus polymorphus TaxID=672921 RepID=UPI003DA4B56C